MTQPVSNFDSLDRLLDRTVGNTYGAYDEHGERALLLIDIGDGEPIGAPYVELDRPSAGVDPGGINLEQMERVTVEVSVKDLPEGLTCLPSTTNVTLYGDEEPYALAERESQFGPVFWTLRLERAWLERHASMRSKDS